MEQKPNVIVSQTINQTICVYASYCNYFQRKIYQNYNAMKNAAFEIYKKTRQYLNATKSHRKILLEDLDGPSGMSDSLLTLILRHDGIDFQPQFNNPILRNGFITLRINNSFRHMICVKNGYAIDSIGSRVYPYHGKIIGYNSFKVENCFDLDAVEDKTIHNFNFGGEINTSSED